MGKTHRIFHGDGQRQMTAPAPLQANSELRMHQMCRLLTFLALDLLLYMLHCVPAPESANVNTRASDEADPTPLPRCNGCEKRLKGVAHSAFTSSDVTPFTKICMGQRIGQCLMSSFGYRSGASMHKAMQQNPFISSYLHDGRLTQDTAQNFGRGRWRRVACTMARGA